MSTVLLVDDDDLVQQTYYELLTDAGHKMLSAVNGNEVLGILEASRPDVVICDIMMPEKDGIETITEIQQNYPDTKLIAISGGGRTKNLDYLKVARMLGAHATFQKPVDASTLLNAINDLAA